MEKQSYGILLTAISYAIFLAFLISLFVNLVVPRELLRNSTVLIILSIIPLLLIFYMHSKTV